MIHVLAIDNADIARIKAGETIELSNGFLLSYQGRTTKVNGHVIADEVETEAARKAEAARERKRAYMREWNRKNPDRTAVYKQRREEREAAKHAGGKFKCTVCGKDFARWEQLRGHMGKHGWKGGVK